MKKTFVMLAALAATLGTSAQTIVETDAYRWVGDSILQGEFKAYAPSDTEIISTYSARPGYYMPVDKVWKLKNDISSYPKLSTSNRLHNAIYNMGLDEMVNAVEPDTTLRTGKEWAGVWTRDVSYSIILSMAYLQPEASKISLMKKVNPRGVIIQDTGSGGAWPVSTDRMVWAVAAYELYKVTGDKEWLKYIYDVIKKSFDDDFKVTYTGKDEAVKGETSFIDWREQSYPRWMQTADIYNSEAMGTSIVHAQALNILSKIAFDLGKKREAKYYAERAEQLADVINKKFWIDDKGYYGMYTYGRNFPILNPRAETLGESLAILFDIASEEQQRAITENNPVTPFGSAIFFPQIADMPNYHNNALWPFVGSYWALANAKAGNEEGTLEAIGAIFRPAALFATNKENFNLDNGDIFTELNSSNMLWSLSGNLALTYRILFGINFEEDGLAFKPFVPKALADKRTLDNFKYRDANLNITVEGYGDRIASFTLNGKEHKPFIPANIKGNNTIVIRMADNDIAPMRVNHTANVKAPLTPITRLTYEGGKPVLAWQPIEYIAAYIVLRDGKPVARTRTTTFDASIPGEYQVIGVSAEGVESFASEPLSTRPVEIVEIGDLTTPTSAEVSYHPVTPIQGYHGKGFAELDHSTAPLTFTFDAPADGTYAIAAVYANGNGPVNTENKCAVRTINVDGNRVGTFVMPHRGVANWDDWGRTNSVHATMHKGTNNVSILFTPDNENMNLGTNHALIDRIEIVKID